MFVDQVFHHQQTLKTFHLHLTWIQPLNGASATTYSRVSTRSVSTSAVFMDPEQQGGETTDSPQDKEIQKWRTCFRCPTRPPLGPPIPLKRLLLVFRAGKWTPPFLFLLRIQFSGWWWKEKPVVVLTGHIQTHQCCSVWWKKWHLSDYSLFVRLPFTQRCVIKWRPLYRPQPALLSPSATLVGARDQLI